MFYMACALLLTRNVRRSKHSAVLAAFNSTFIQSGEVSSDLFALLRDGFEDRAEGDYGLAVISREQASVGIAGAQRFVTEMKRRFAEGPLPGTSSES
jgi:uncharacterized protein (UPF0332 family)